MGGGRSGVARIQPNEKVESTLRRIIRQTSALKNEQYRIIDENGNVVVESRGKKHEVATTVGQKREHMEGAVSIHNHPNGGTFSSADLRDFGFGAREIVVTAPNGEQYRLTNTKYGTKQAKEGWRALQEAMDRDLPQDMSFTAIRKRAEAIVHKTKEYKAMTKASETWVKRRSEGASQEELKKYQDVYEKNGAVYRQKLRDTERSLEVRPHHDYLKRNAKKYGFKYTYKNPK